MNDNVSETTATNSQTNAVPSTEPTGRALDTVLARSFKAGQQHGYEAGFMEGAKIVSLGSIAIFAVGAFIYYCWPVAKDAAK